MENEEEYKKVAIAAGKDSQSSAHDSYMTKGDYSPIIVGNNNTVYSPDALVIPLLDENGKAKLDDQRKPLAMVIPEKLAIKIFGSRRAGKEALLSMKYAGNVEPLRKLFENQAVKDALQKKKINIERKNDAVLKIMLDRAMDVRASTTKDGSIMAESVLGSLKKNRASISSVKGFASKAKNRFFYFISAITKKQGTDQNTLEYKVAKVLKDKLGSENVFWWEDQIDEATLNNWFVSTKIAMGLGFSSVFIGLAFDTTEKSKDGYCFKCLMQGEKAYKKPAYFYYEAVTYISFLRNKAHSQKFLRGIVDKGDVQAFVPPNRQMRIYAYGEPDRGAHDYAIIDDLEKRNGFWIDTADGKFEELQKQFANDEEGLAQAIADTIIGRIKEEQTNKTLPIPLQNVEQSYFFKPFDPSHFQDGKYCDDFLGADWGKKEGIVWIKNGTKENIASVPTDYFFEYAIIAQNCKNAKNHFLIFPERYTDPNGNFTWRMKLVVRDWNLAALADSEYKDILLGGNGTKCVSAFPYTQYRYISFVSDNGSSVGPVTYSAYSGKNHGATDINNGTNNWCAFILDADVLEHTSGNLCGELTLSKEENFNDPKNTVKFYVSIKFYIKKILYYSLISPNAGKLVGNTANSDIRIQIAASSQSNPHIAIGNDYTIVGHAVLKKGKQSFTIECDQGKVDKAHLSNYRALIADSESAKYYTLLHADFADSHSLFSKSTQKPKMQQNRFVKCPCCGRYISSNKKDENNPEYCYDDGKQPKGAMRKCQYNFINDSVKLPDSQGTEFEIIKCENPSGEAIISDDKKIGYKESFENGIVVSFLGGTQTGKSTFISNLFSVRNKKITCEYLKGALKPYVQSVEFCGVSSKEKQEINAAVLQEHYSSMMYDEFVTKTSRNTECTLPHIPFIMNLGKIQDGGENIYQNEGGNIYLSFFDIAGALATGIDYQKYYKDINKTMVFRSDCLIVLVNGTRNESGQEGIASDSISDVLGFISKQAGVLLKEKADEWLKNTLIAVVVCKFDTFAENFHENCYSRILPPIAPDVAFKDSDRHKYIDETSKEVEEYLKGFQGGLIESLKKFSHVKYFAVSSMGRADSAIWKGKETQNDNSTKTVYYTNPQNIENILLWMMYEKGIIV